MTCIIVARPIIGCFTRYVLCTTYVRMMLNVRCTGVCLSVFVASIYALHGKFENIIKHVIYNIHY